MGGAVERVDGLVVDLGLLNDNARLAELKGIHAVGPVQMSLHENIDIVEGQAVTLKPFFYWDIILHVLEVDSVI